MLGWLDSGPSPHSMNTIQLMLNVRIKPPRSAMWLGSNIGSKFVDSLQNSILDE